MRDNWKLWLAGAVVLVVVGFAAYHIRSSFREPTPAWLNFQEAASPPLAASVKEPFLVFRKEIETESKTTGFPIQSLHLAEVLPGGKSLRIWHLEHFTNLGMNPVSEMGVPHWMPLQLPYGFYTMDGVPLHFSARHHPSHPNVSYMAVQLDQPLAPGASQWVVCIENQANKFEPDAAGEVTYHFGRLRKSDTTIQAVGLILPEGGQLVRYSPSSSAITMSAGLPMVGWINTRLDDVTLPPTAIFKVP